VSHESPNWSLDSRRAGGAIKSRQRTNAPSWRGGRSTTRNGLPTSAMVCRTLVPGSSHVLLR